MSKNVPVINLIQSLNMSEKRYFKIFSERHVIGEKNKYLILFNCIAEMPDNREEHLIPLLKEQGYNTRYLSADKNYLYQLVLKSLTNFHAERTIALGLKEKLMEVEILFHKGLFQDCLQLIEKTEAEAKAAEYFGLVIDLLQWKKKCAGYSLGLDEAAAINKDIANYISLQDNLKRATDDYYVSNYLMKDADRHAPEQKKEKVKQLQNDKHLKTEKDALSLSAQLFYHLTESNYALVSGNLKQEINHLQNSIDLIHQHSFYAKENPYDYISIYNRLLWVKKYIANEEEFLGDTSQLESFPNQVSIQKNTLEQRVNVHVNCHRLSYFLYKNNFKGIYTILNNLEQNQKSLIGSVEYYHLIYLEYLKALANVFTGKAKQALKIVNSVLNTYPKEARPQIFYRIKVLSALIYFDLKNHEWCEEVIKQNIKENKKTNFLFDFELIILDGLLELLGMENERSKFYIQHGEAIQKKLEIKSQDRFSDQNILLENYLKWWKAKIKKQNVEEWINSEK